MRAILLGIGLAIGVAAATTAQAADKVKIGFISTLSGPNASIGIDIRDAFNLAIKLNGGKLGGLPAEVLVDNGEWRVIRRRQTIDDQLALET